MLHSGSDRLILLTMDDHIMCCDTVMPISCHFGDCEALLVTSLIHVSRAIAGAWTFTFYVLRVYLDSKIYCVGA